MLSLQKNIVSNRTNHENTCWVAKNVDSIDLISGIARIRFFGYKDVEAYVQGKEAADIIVIERNINDYPIFEQLFQDAMLKELEKEDGEFFESEVYEITDIDYDTFCLQNENQEVVNETEQVLIEE